MIDSIIVQRILELKDCSDPFIKQRIIEDINYYLKVNGFNGYLFISDGKILCSDKKCEEYLIRILKERGFNDII